MTVIYYLMKIKHISKGENIKKSGKLVPVYLRTLFDHRNPKTLSSENPYKKMTLHCKSK